MFDLDAEFARACALPHEGTAFDALPARDRILIAIWGLEADVNNGGFDQYYFNSSGNHAFFAPDALEAIGAMQMAALVRKANSHFGPEGPSRDWYTRQDQLFALNDEDEERFEELDKCFFKYPDDIAAMLIAYFSRMPS